MKEVDLDVLAAEGSDVHRMGEAHARARYSDIDASTPSQAFATGFRDGAAAALGVFPETMIGVSDFRGYLVRMCDPDVAGSAGGTGPAWTVAGPAPGTTFSASIEAEARTCPPEAAGAAPIDAYVLGFKRGTAAALLQVSRVASVLYEWHAELARLHGSDRKLGEVAVRV